MGTGVDRIVKVITDTTVSQEKDAEDVAKLAALMPGYEVRRVPWGRLFDPLPRRRPKATP